MADVRELKPQFDKLMEISSQRVDKFYSFVKTLLTLAGGMIAILVSLKTDTDIKIIKILFTVTVGLLSIGILFSSLVLYTEIIGLAHLEKSFEGYILELLKDNTNKTFVETANPGKLFPIAKWGMIISFVLALCCLTAYSYLS